MQKMSDEQFKAIKDVKENDPAAWKAYLAVPKILGNPGEIFLTLCAFYQRDLNLTYEQAHAYTIKEHPDCFEAFLEANTRNPLQR